MMENAHGESSADQEIQMALETHPKNLVAEDINPNQLDESNSPPAEISDK